MNAISLIVRGDDFGLCHASNQAVCEAFETGLLTCASLVVVTPWLAEAVKLAQEYSEWEIGLQLVLGSPTGGYRWGPVCGARAVPSLVEPAGTFPPSLAGGAQPEEVARELGAQVERVQACGIRPAYLVYDGADHPVVGTALQQLSERLGVPVWMTSWGIQPLALPEPSANAFEKALASLKPGTYLWLTHPAQASPEISCLWPEPQTAATRYAETLALCNPEIRALLEQRGIERISFRQHLEERLGTETDE
jgi:predicted glycoside hydrolase/deacetylase ChbG (UPF0249 family)